MTLVQKLEMFYKICKNKSPKYLFKLIPEKAYAYATRNVANIPVSKSDTTSSKTFSFLLQSLNGTI